MSSRLIIGAVAIVGLAVGGWALYRSNSAKEEKPATSVGAPASRGSQTVAVATNSKTTAPQALSEIDMPLFPREEAVRYLEDVASAADNQQIRTVSRYLSHTDATVRAAAREALVQIGGQESVHLLKDAAEKANDPEEAAELRKAASFVALPSWTEFRKERAAPSQGQTQK